MGVPQRLERVLACSADLADLVVRHGAQPVHIGEGCVLVDRSQGFQGLLAQRQAVGDLVAGSVISSR